MPLPPYHTYYYYHYHYYHHIAIAKGGCLLIVIAATPPPPHASIKFSPIFLWAVMERGGEVSGRAIGFGAFLVHPPCPPMYQPRRIPCGPKIPTTFTPPPKIYIYGEGEEHCLRPVKGKQNAGCNGDNHHTTSLPHSAAECPSDELPFPACLRLPTTPTTTTTTTTPTTLPLQGGGLTNCNCCYPPPPARLNEIPPIFLWAVMERGGCCSLILTAPPPPPPIASIEFP